jgi:hypothetical protein
VGQALLDVLPWAIGVSLSPTATTAVILLLMTRRPRANAAAMIAGWVLSLIVVTAIAYVAVTVLHVSHHDRDSPGVDILRVVLGALLLGMGAVWWRRRRRSGSKRRLPQWMQAVDTFTPRRSFVLGVALGDVKNFILTIAAVAGAVASPIHAIAQFSLMVVFVIVGSLCVLAPLVVYMVTGSHAPGIMARWRDWLEANTALLMIIVLLALGVAMIGRGVLGLTA